MLEKFTNVPTLLKERFINHCPFKHPDLQLVKLSGSFGNRSNDVLSDLDITTVLEPKNPMVVNVDDLLLLANQLNSFAQSLAADFSLAPVVISSIRLEEAQIALAGVFGGKVLPIHWLFYPSVEFAFANESPGLFLNLIKGQTILGNEAQTQAKFASVKEDHLESLIGLDWLTDSLRVLLANINPNNQNLSFQPVSFLKSLAMHNLEYFWKWRILGKIAKQSGIDFQNYNQLELLPIDPELKQVAELVRVNRHLGEKAGLSEIINLHKFTFEIWPQISQSK